MIMNAVFLAVQGVAAHPGSFEPAGGVLVEEALGEGQFAVVLSAAAGALGERLAGGVEAEGHDASEPAFGSEGLGVEGQGFGKKIAVFPQPGVQGAGEFDRIDPVDDVVERAVARHGEPAGFLVAPGQSDGAALVLVERSALAPDGFDVLGAAEESIDDEREHGAEGMADGFGVAGVGEAAQGVAQRAQLGAFQGAAGPGGAAFGDGRLVGGPGRASRAKASFFKGRPQRCLGLPVSW